MVQPVGQRAQLTFHVHEIEGDPRPIHFLGRERQLHHVPVPVHALALALVMPQIVRAVVVRLYAHDEHDVTLAPAGGSECRFRAAA